MAQAKKKTVDTFELTEKFLDDYGHKIMKHAGFPFDAAAVMAMGIVVDHLAAALCDSGNDEVVCDAIKRAKQFYNNSTKF